MAAFLGRETERDTLRDWLHDTRTRLVAVVGMGGIGKTLLATRAAVDVSAVFERVCWRSLRDAPPFEGWLSETMTILSPNETRTRGATGFERLLEIAQKAACLLVLDNFEVGARAGSQAGRYRPGTTDMARCSSTSRTARTRVG